MFDTMNLLLNDRFEQHSSSGLLKYVIKTMVAARKKKNKQRNKEGKKYWYRDSVDSPSGENVQRKSKRTTRDCVRRSLNKIDSV